MGERIRLRNRNTGEIAYADKIRVYSKGGHEDWTSLADLSLVWEEVGVFYMIDALGQVQAMNTGWSMEPYLKNFGNYFPSQEEAEKAVKCLRAWKRLKDKGFRFDAAPALGHRDDEKFDISIIATMPVGWWYDDKVVDDINYVLGGEE